MNSSLLYILNDPTLNKIVDKLSLEKEKKEFKKDASRDRLRKI